VNLLRSIDARLFGSLLDAYSRMLEAELVGQCESVLDVGCGDRSPLARFRGRIPLMVGVDAHAPSLERSRALGIHDRYEQCDVTEIAARFPPRSFDAVVALDVIEHLEKPQGLRLLDALETVARKRVIVFTPNRFLPQGEREGNPWQVHRSGWTVEDFAARGYRVLGVNGWKPLRGALAMPRLRPRSLGARLSALTQPWVTHRPRHAFQLLAVRDLG
jgi:SAM-dependent methyltransferase